MDNKLLDLYEKYFNALYEGDRKTAARVIMEAADEGVDIRDIYLYVFQACQYKIGELWEKNKMSVAGEHYFSAATQLVMSQLYPKILNENFKNTKGYKFVAASVSKELHEIGLRMVVDFLELDGWDTYYLGANTPSDAILQGIIDYNPHVVGLSTTMDYYIPEITTTIEKIRESKGEKELKIMVGGYPFIEDRGLWKKVGADAFAVNAKDAVKVANTLVEQVEEV